MRKEKKILKDVSKCEKTSKTENGNLMARVFIRKTGAIVDKKGNYIINSQDLFGWFENGDYLKKMTEWDTV